MNPLLKDKLLPACEAVARELREWKATQALLHQEQLRRAPGEFVEFCAQYGVQISESEAAEFLTSWAAIPEWFPVGALRAAAVPWGLGLRNAFEAWRVSRRPTDGRPEAGGPK